MNDDKPIQILVINPSVTNMLDLIAIIQQRADECMVITAGMLEEAADLHDKPYMKIKCVQQPPEQFYDTVTPSTIRNNTIKRPCKLPHLQPQW